METVIQTKALCKYYGKKRAVDNLSMTVRKGDIYGFIGSNGAGKSTALKLISSLAAPTSGEASIFGKPANDPIARKRTGILIESPGIYPRQSAYENMMLKACCLGLVNAKEKIAGLLELVGLSDAGKKSTRQFSMGMKQRLGIGLALLGDPDLLILDEPINGLDPEGMAEVRLLLQKLNRERGITILLSSHILSELSKLATRYGIIRDGKIIQEITSGELEESCQDYLCVQVDKPKEASVCLERVLHITDYEVRPDGQLRIYNDCPGNELCSVFSTNSIAVNEIYLHHRNLDEYFVEMMGGAANE